MDLISIPLSGKTSASGPLGKFRAQCAAENPALAGWRIDRRPSLPASRRFAIHSPLWPGKVVEVSAAVLDSPGRLGRAILDQTGQLTPRGFPSFWLGRDMVNRYATTQADAWIHIPGALDQLLNGSGVVA